MPDKREELLEAFEAALTDAAVDSFDLTLYVAGANPRSTRAIQTLRRVCEDHLPGRYKLDVVDLYEHPEKARAANIVGAPTLVKQHPVPQKKLIGDVRDESSLLMALGLPPTGKPSTA